MATVKYWVWLSNLSGVRPKTKYRLLEHFSAPRSIFFANESEYDAIEGITGGEKQALSDKNLLRANEILGKCDELGVQIITIGDTVYPERLRNIFDPPIVLYARGKLPWLDEEVPIGVVGTRKASTYGISMGQRFGYEITKGGGLVVTGLATGVDSAGARGALLAGGRCIGVLGTGIDVVYPRGNGMLFDDVRYHGALISEFPPGYPTQSGNFPQRNRIISGLSVGVLIIEAPKKSGALITAARAAEQGRDVFAVPGNVDQPNCAGTNELIRDGAKAVVCGNDILCEYTGVYPEKIRIISEKEARMPSRLFKEKTAEKSTSSGKNASGETKLKEEDRPLRRETGEGFAKLREPNPLRMAKRRETLSQQLAGLSVEQLSIITAIGDESRHVDDIIEQTGLAAPKVLSELTMLQIKGFVTQEKGKRFSLNVKNTK